VVLIACLLKRHKNIRIYGDQRDHLQQKEDLERTAELNEI
jgi:hypothetical protein